MSGKGAVSGKTILVFAAIGVGVGILVGAVFGWHYAILGLGAALGPVEIAAVIGILTALGGGAEAGADYVAQC